MNTTSNVMPINKLSRVYINRDIADTYRCPAFFERSRKGYIDSIAPFMLNYSTLNDKFYETYREGNLKVCETSVRYAKRPGSNTYFGYSDGTHFHILGIKETYSDFDEYVVNTNIEEDKALKDFIVKRFPTTPRFPEDYDDVYGNELSNIEFASYISNMAIEYHNFMKDYMKANNIPFVEYNEHMDTSNMVGPLSEMRLKDTYRNFIIYEAGIVRLRDIKFKHTINTNNKTFINDFEGKGFIKFMETNVK